MFDLGNDADLPVVFHGQPTELVDVVLEGRHTPQAVVQRVVLPDEQYGSGVIRSAKQEAMILAIPIEASGRAGLPHSGAMPGSITSNVSPRTTPRFWFATTPTCPPIDDALSFMTSPKSALPSAR